VSAILDVDRLWMDLRAKFRREVAPLPIDGLPLNVSMQAQLMAFNVVLYTNFTFSLHRQSVKIHNYELNLLNLLILDLDIYCSLFNYRIVKREF
jgi:hypothetical protein